MSKIDYQALREKAEKATKGSYIVGHTSVNQHGNLTGVFVCQKWKGEPGGVIAECHVNCLVETDAQAYANAEFIAAFNPNVALALLDERERNQQYIKRRDQENEEIALTVGKLRVELEAAENNLIDSECHVAELEEALRDKQALLEASEKRNAKLQSENAYIRNRYINRKYAPIDEKLMALHKWFWEQSEAERAAGIRIKGDAGEQNDEKP
ncbi:TPA: ead/Ea22-like family protein [Escherichia coli]